MTLKLRPLHQEDGEKNQGEVQEVILLRRSSAMAMWVLHESKCLKTNRETMQTNHIINKEGEITEAENKKKKEKKKKSAAVFKRSFWK